MILTTYNISNFGSVEVFDIIDELAAGVLLPFNDRSSALTVRIIAQKEHSLRVA